MPAKKSRKRKKVSRRSRPPAPRRRRILGWSLVFLAVVLFVCLGTAPLHEDHWVHPDAGGVLGKIAAEVSSPLFYLFGRAAYAVPFAFVLVGVVLLWRFYYVRRTRLVIRLLFSVPLLAFLLSGVALILGEKARLGGQLGEFYFRYFGFALGETLGLVVGTLLVLLLGCLLWGIHPWTRRAREARKRKTPVKDTFIAIGRGIRWVAVGIGSGIAYLVRRVSKKPRRGKPGMAAKPFKTQPGSWSPNTSGTWETSGGSAPWSAPPTDRAPDDDDESLFQPLPEPGLATPIPLGILPDFDTTSADHQSLQEQLPDLQKSLIDVIRRTTKVKLVASQLPPRLGMNTIQFELEKKAGQEVSVTKVERALADIGVETKRAPARMELGDAVRIELPLHDKERTFAPVKTLLQATIPEEGRPVTYLIGRRQDGSPFELKVDDAKHVLVGGGTGGGKTVLLHSIIFGLIFRYPPSAVRLALADNKVFEFSRYRGLPHLWQEVVITTEGFVTLVENLSEELQRRKQALVEDQSAKFTTLVTIIDEFSGYDSEKLVRLIAEARALNMYFILATQHPTADVISTSIKANLVTGIAFRTRSHTGSRLIISSPDATSLLLRGDCLVQSPSGLTRVQAGWVTGPKDRDTSDLDALIRYIKEPPDEG